LPPARHGSKAPIFSIGLACGAADADAANAGVGWAAIIEILFYAMLSQFYRV
jgi:hypothetical protein